MTAGIIVLYCVATAVAMASSRLRIPYTAALMITGMALGATHIVPLPHLTKDLLFAVFLPGLLFEAAYTLGAKELRDNAWTIGALAVPGVAAAIGLTAVFVVAGNRLGAGAGTLSWTTALVFGAVIAATDPVAVTAFFRELRAPRRLQVLVESESLFNDGTAIVFLTLILAAVTGSATGVGALALSFVRIAGGGAIIGAAIGWAVSHVRTRTNDHAIEITVTTIAAYGSFVAAEYWHCSGVIATVVAGIVCGNSLRQRTMTPVSQEAIRGFWEWVAFALNSAVFILLGAEVSPPTLANEWQLVMVAAVAALAARAIVVGAVSVSLAKTGERLPAPWAPVLVWGGLRGALSLVLALSLPDGSGDHSLIVAMTAGTVVLSLVGQGTTMPMLLKRLRIAGGPA